MISFFAALGQDFLGLLAFAILVLPVGYLAAFAIDVHGFRHRAFTEQMLWSVALGLPLSTLGNVLLLPFLTAWGTLAVFLVPLAITVTLALRRPRPPSPPRRALRASVVLAILLSLYPALALVDIPFHDHLFLSTVVFDWAVRVPFVDSILVRGLPPLNPLSALTGTAPTLHYYYFWSVLCAQVARLAHVPGRAALVASCSWCALDLLAVIFLSLKYLLDAGRHLRGICFAAVAALGIMGLDILILASRIAVHHQHPTFEMEWWREDRTPSFLGTILYAPHHIAGMMFALTAYLLLVGLFAQPISLRRGVSFAVLAGACFAATAGTSTYIAFLFCLVCLVWAADLLRHRQWRLLGVLAACGLVAFLLSGGFLHSLVTTSTGNQAGTGVSGATHFAVLRFRNQHFADNFLAAKHILPRSPIPLWTVRRLAALAMLVLELGFFLLVLLRQFRLDLLRPGSLSPGRRALWWLLLGTAVPGLFLSSGIIAIANDLGMHAAILVRLVLVLWAAPWLYSLWERRRSGLLTAASPLQRLVPFAVAVTLALGVSGQIAQILLERFYLPAIESRLLPKATDTLTSDRLSHRLFQIRSMWQALDSRLAPDAIVQFDPLGKLQPAMLFYSNRQVAASDDGCGTGFGGDYALCPPVVAQLRTAFAVGPKSLHSVLPWDDQGAVEEPTPVSSVVPTSADFHRLCRDLHLAAVLVDSKDPVWAMPQSWVWTEPAFFTSDTDRAYLCPDARDTSSQSALPSTRRAQ